jgi:hypothetical protein
MFRKNVLSFTTYMGQSPSWEANSAIVSQSVTQSLKPVSKSTIHSVSQYLDQLFYLDNVSEWIIQVVRNIQWSLRWQHFFPLQLWLTFTREARLYIRLRILKMLQNLFTFTYIRVKLLGMFLLLASCNEFAGTPMEAPYESSITRAAYRG